MSTKEIRRKNKEFFSSSTWLNYISGKLDRNQNKKDIILAERLIHNKCIREDGMSVKERRKAKNRERRLNYQKYYKNHE